MATHFSILAWRIPMDRAAWWAAVHRVKSWTRLSDFHFFQERYVRLNLRKSANAAVGAFSPQAPESIFSIPLSDPNTCVPAQSLQVCPAL